MLKFQVISDFNELDAIQTEWDILLHESGFSDVFSSYGFSKAWWRAYGSGKCLRVIVGWENGSVKVVAPFFARQASPKTWSLIGNERGDYNNFIFKAGNTSVVLQLIEWLSKISDWDTIVMRKIPTQSDWSVPILYTPLSSIWEKFIVWVNLRFPVSYQTLHWQHYYLDRPSLEKENEKIRQSASRRRDLNWFSRIGEVSFRSIKNPQDIQNILPSFMELHIREWASRGEESLFSIPENQAFYFYLVEELSRYLHALQMDIFEVNGKLVAAHFGFVWMRRQYYYKPCFDMYYASHSPGKTLLSYIFQKACLEDIDELDFLMGDEAYKRKYNALARPTASMIIYRNRFIALKQRFG